MGYNELTLRHRFSRISQAVARTSPSKRFPFIRASDASPSSGLNYHLVRTVIPAIVLANSLGDFLGDPGWSLASFAAWVSNAISFIFRPWKQKTVSPSTQATQGRLHCFKTIGSRFRIHPAYSQVFPVIDRSPRKQGRHLHAIADCPIFLNPRPTPSIGHQKHWQGTSSICPLADF